MSEEKKEKELVPVPEKTVSSEVEPIKELLPLNMDPGVSIEAQIAKAERHVSLQKKLMEIVLNATNEKDWIDNGGIPYLEATGARKIRRCVGCDISDVSFERVDFPDDEKGPYFVYEVIGNISWNGQTVCETGSGSSRDAFFAKRKGKLLPMSEVDCQNIRKKAVTNFWNRAIKNLLGLSFTWAELDEITKGRITKKTCTGVEYKGSKKAPEKDTPEVTAKRAEIRDMMVKLYGKEEAPNKLEKNTAWPEKNVKGKRNVKDLSAKQVEFVHKGLLIAYKKWQAEGATVTRDDPPGTEPKNEREMPPHPSADGSMPYNEDDDLPF